MKKLAALILLLCLLGSTALADFDFSSFDFDALTISEMVILRERLITEIMKREDFQEVLVPQGLYEIGVDIPAGKWTVRCLDAGREDTQLAECDIRWGSGMPGQYFDWDRKTKKGAIVIYNPKNVNYINGKTSEFSITLEEGDFLYVNAMYNAAIFSTYVGPSFKFH
ncbi:MAG: hypothetical protein IKQ24_07270 [Verrucomicrobia bacterium]|nr:hypothetical protein [Verrucomicrobiota bacterium]